VIRPQFNPLADPRLRGHQRPDSGRPDRHHQNARPGGLQPQGPDHRLRLTRLRHERRPDPHRPPDDSPTLGRVAIIGQLYDSVWNIAGEIDYLYVKYWVTNTEIRSTGDMDEVAFGGMDSSNLYAGVADGLVGLLDPNTAFANQATIERLTLRGIPFSQGIYEIFINSNLAASSLGTVSLGGVKINNADHDNE